jgi:hypothetical protein
MLEEFLEKLGNGPESGPERDSWKAAWPVFHKLITSLDQLRGPVMNHVFFDHEWWADKCVTPEENLLLAIYRDAEPDLRQKMDECHDIAIDRTIALFDEES